MKVDLRYLWKDRDRHGNLRYYVKVPGRRKLRIREEPGTVAFNEAYNAAVSAEPADTGRPKAKPGTLRWLCERYYGSAAFKGLGARTRTVRRQILDRLCEKHGHKPCAMLEPRHVRELRDELAEKPEAANGRLKALRQVFACAREDDLIDHDPVREVAYITTASEGFHTWTVEEIAQYREHHPLGTKARLALDILLYTGARRSDAVTFGRQMVRDGWLHWVEFKGRKKKRKERAIPVLPDLQASLDACPSGHMTWLVTAFGKPFTPNGFGNRFRKWCDDAGLPRCSAHGLRKAGATIAADNGATEHQLMAIYGWETTKQAGAYTRKANRRRLAGDGMRLISVAPAEREGNEILPLSGDGTPTAKKAK